MRQLAALVLVLALCLALSSPPATAQFIVLDPANLYQQIIQYAQMLLQYYRQYQQLVQEVEQLANLIEQLQRMDTNLLVIEGLDTDNQGRWLYSLRRALERLEGIVYSADDVLSRYDALHHLAVPEDLSLAESERRRAALDTYRALIIGANQTAQDSESAARTLERLTEQLESAEGNLQALQALGALTTQVAAESARTAEVNAMTLNALTVQFSEELAAQEQARITFDSWLRQLSDPRTLPTQEFDPVPSRFRGGLQ